MTHLMDKRGQQSLLRSCVVSIKFYDWMTHGIEITLVDKCSFTIERRLPVHSPIVFIVLKTFVYRKPEPSYYPTLRTTAACEYVEVAFVKTIVEQ